MNFDFERYIGRFAEQLAGWAAAALPNLIAALLIVILGLSFAFWAGGGRHGAWSSAARGSTGHSPRASVPSSPTASSSSSRSRRSASSVSRRRA
jgi:hypothetical protein